DRVRAAHVRGLPRGDGGWRRGRRRRRHPGRRGGAPHLRGGPRARAGHRPRLLERPPPRVNSVDRAGFLSLYGTAMTEHAESRALRVLREIVESGRPLVYVRSAEEQRVTALLREVASALLAPPVPLWVWSLTRGMRRDGTAGDGELLGPRAAL